ncbi:MAG: PRC-barrel domain-containing protein [Coriobacteriaceae bacterium]|jgi:uncharacterized protein YrrD|nr:PRC-barrel domain-containing protein [Coriobacteriaceae bacterium]
MTKNTISSNELIGARVVGGKSGIKRIGKVRHLVFHPSERRAIGFIVKRPDFLWMFRRKDQFVSLDSFDWLDGRVVVRNTPDATDGRAYKRLGLNPDVCVIWIGLPLMTQDGSTFGLVGNVTFNLLTGTVLSVESDSGMASNTLLGRRTIPAEMIQGFHKGMGTALSMPGSGTDLAHAGGDASKGDPPVILGALLVCDEAAAVVAEGGVAEKAGKATAVVAEKAGKVGAAVSRTASAAAKTTGKAVNIGAYATGRQLGKSKGMFSAFKEEYKKSRHGR